MKILVLLLVLLSGIIACNKQKEETACLNSSKKHYFKEKARIDTGSTAQNFYVTQTAGEKLVFFYEVNNEPCQPVQDGGRFDKLIFEVDPGSSSFEYSQSDFASKMVYFSTSCGECPQALLTPAVPESGSISGVRRSANAWYIQLDVSSVVHGRLGANSIFLRN